MSNSDLYDKVYGCMAGGNIGDAMGQPVEAKTYEEIEAEFGMIEDFDSAGTDDSLLKHLMIEAILRSDGYITADEWAEIWREEFVKKEVYRWLYIPVRNAWHKLQAEKTIPRDCGLGNMASSSSAMCISPMGIINACFPKQAFLEAFQVASLIHHNFCRDAAAAMAAAIAEAFNPEATVDSVLEKSIKYLPRESLHEFISHYNQVMELLSNSNNYKEFRARIQNDYIEDIWVISDSRDTVISALALFKLADGDPEKAIIYGANFGRDTDTIASMVGSLAGAYSGIKSFPEKWVEKLNKKSDVNQQVYAKQLTNVILKRRAELMDIVNSLNKLAD